MSHFAICLDRVLKHEGGWANHPADPGGATMQGVTQRTYDAWRDLHLFQRRSVRHIERWELEAIYRAGYWDAVRASQMPLGVGYCTFDAAVNSGPHRAAQWLQRAVGVDDDGAIGPITLAAVGRAVPSETIQAACKKRMAFLRRRKTWPVFGKGWQRRVESVERDALADALAVGDQPILGEPILGPVHSGVY